ncbi:MAG TPA: LamG-like jellyroll fold domain-containing protein [Cyclobacteriaceae bacterium]|nr:LamG-like jellyroll fold domain-containing protein [Cyclobacteriaceae bacterium]
MKKRIPKLTLTLLLMVALAGLVNLSSCSDDEKTPPADKTALTSTIDDADELLANTVEGTNDGEYPAAARAALQSAIDAAEAVEANTAATQAQVDAAKNSLEAAIDTYEAAVITPIAEADLIFHYKFDEGTGTTITDQSANALVGTFKTGHADWGAGYPEWSADRNGDANKAIHFDEGANIEIPYNTKLNPEQMTISLWINADEIRENNRFLGLQSWIAYKFQLQSTNRPFFTVHSSDDAYFDRDAEIGLPINEWHHIAVTFGGGNMVFYIDGEVAKTWDNTPGTAMSISGAPYNLVIGQDFPTDQYAPTPDNFDTDHKIPLAWGGYFHGYLDEFRMYKAVLSDSQIQSIYDREKPQ